MKTVLIWVSKETFFVILLAITYRSCLQRQQGWCHLAKTNMTGKQEPGGMWDKDIDYNRGIEMDMNENSTMKERACILIIKYALHIIFENTI